MKIKSKLISPALMLICAFLGYDCGQSVNEAPVGGEGNITAGQGIARVDSLSRLGFSGMILMRITSDAVADDGTSKVWYYDFMETVPSFDAYRFHCTEHSVGFDGKISLGAGAATIAHSWFDSDIAIAIAERNGGREFRSQNPICTIEATLLVPVLGSGAANWYITYHRTVLDSSGLGLIIDANTGVVYK